MGRDKGGGPLGLVAKGVTGLVGLATEVHKYQHDKKAAAVQEPTQQPERSFADSNGQCHLPPLSTHLPEDDDERLHQLDDLSHEIDEKPPSYDEVAPSSSIPNSWNVDEKALSVSARSVRSLPFPIILPQRRPGSKARGFIRAYPPSIGEYKGIDQSTFLGFLKEFHQQSQASHVFEVIIVGAEGAKWAPSSIAMVVGTSVQMAAIGGKELHSRSRTNNYLNEVNKDLFHPVNLHAMIMAFDPDISGHKVVDVDTSSGMSAPTINTQASETTMSALASSTHASGLGAKFKITEGTTRSEAELVHAAPLIFPTIDRAVIEEPHGSSNHGGKFKRAGKFLSDYLDRRAQAEYAAKHGADSALAIPGAMDSSRFASRFSNPNDPASSGNLRALLPIGGGSSPQGGANGTYPSSNGSVPPGGYGSSGHSHEKKHAHERRHSHERKHDHEKKHNHGGKHSPQTSNNVAYDSRENSPDRSVTQYQNGQVAQQNQEPPPKAGAMAGISKFLKPGILYLLIAELPTSEELENMGVHSQ